MDNDVNLTWFLGKVHEVFSYGLVAVIACLASGIVGFDALVGSALNPAGSPNYFLFYLFWSLIGFIPVSVICAFSTKYIDKGEGLLFSSNSIVIIMFGHLFEDLLGIVGTPFWFLRDLFTHRLGGWKTVDYLIYLALIVFIATGVLQLAL